MPYGATPKLGLHLFYPGEGSTTGLQNENMETLDDAYMRGTFKELDFPGGGTDVPIDARDAETYRLTVTDNVDFTIDSPSNELAGMRMLLIVKNSSGGAMGSITWGADFKMAAFVEPDNGKQRTIQFVNDGFAWIQVGLQGPMV